MFSIVGFVGRYCALRSFRAGHSKRWCSTVSLGDGQRGQERSSLTPILDKWEFSGTCCVRRRKIVLDSFLFSSFILSFGFGVVMCWNMVLPVSPIAHSFIHSSFLFALIICLAVSMEVGTSGCGHDAPCFAKVSALSLPCIFTCPGIHWRVRLISWSVSRQSIVLMRFLIVKLFYLPLSKACSTDFASEKTTISFLAFVLSLKCFDIFCSEACIASASAS